MPVHAECPSCQLPFLVPDSIDIKDVKCPRCRSAVAAAARTTQHAPAGSSGALPASPLVGKSRGGSKPSATLAPAPGSPTAVAAAPAKPVAPSAARRLTRLVLDLPGAVVRQMPGQPEGVAGLSLVALAVGLVAWALTALTHERLFGLIISAAGLLLAVFAVATLVRRGQKGIGLPVAAGIVNLQAMAFAALFAFAPGFGPAAAQAGNPIDELRKAMKDQDQNARLKAAFAVGELARDLSKTVLELLNLMRDANPSIRSAAAEALGGIGPAARLAYPGLDEAAEADPDEQVRAKARAAKKKIGAPTKTDLGPFWDLLKDNNPAVKAAAVDVLRLIGEGAQPAVLSLEMLLDSPDTMVRVSAAHALWVIDKQTEAALKALKSGLKDLDARVRGRSARALADMQGAARDAVADLGNTLKDQDPLVRFKAAFALASIGKDASGKVQQLANALEDSSVKVRLYAARALWEIDRSPVGVPVFVEALSHKEAEIRLTAAVGLWTVSKDAREAPKELLAAAPALSKALEDSDGAVRGHAAFTLAALKAGAADAIGKLTEGLKHDDIPFRATCAYALSAIGPAAKESIPALKIALSDKNGEVRLFAAQAIWAIDKDKAPVAELLGALTKLMQDRDGVLRAKAALALGLMGPQAAAAVPELNEALRDGGNAALRATAAEALGKIGAAARVTYPALAELGKEENVQVRKAAMEAMKKIKKPSPVDVPELQKALKSKNPALQQAALVALWTLGTAARSAADDVAGLLADKDDAVRRTAPYALAAMVKDKEASKVVPALIKALGHDDEELSARAAFALGEIGKAAADAEPALTDLLQKSKNAAVRLYAAVALFSIRPQTQQVIDTLSGLAGSKEVDSGLRVAAAETLMKVAASPEGKKGQGAAALEKTAAPALRAALTDGDDAVKPAAAAALGGLGLAARAEIFTLMLALEDADPDVRTAAATALGKIAQAEKETAQGVRAKVAYAALVFFSKVEQHPQARQAANEALPRIGQPTGKDVPLLLSVIRDGEAPPGFRTAAAQAVGLVGSEVKQHIADLIKVMEDKEGDAGLRSMMAYTLGDLMGDAVKAVPELANLAKDTKEDPGVRAAAVFALGEIGPSDRKRVAVYLRHILNIQNDNETVRLTAEEALRKTTGGK